MTPGNFEDRDKERLLFLGWFIKEKGIYDLVDAINRIEKDKPGIHLDFYGTKNEDDLKRYIHENRLEKHISVHGWIGDLQKIEVLKKCTALILPSHSEGIPNVILEAMATKTPIISTLIGGLTEILEDDKNAIIIRVGDSIDIGEKILKCLENSDLRFKIAERAYMDAKNKFDVTVIRKKFQTIISEVLR
jgi:glycosyltransferase involved in cell wall biosynthesis